MPDLLDGTVIVGIVLVAVGVWFEFGPGATLILVGAVMVTAGIGLAMTRR